MSYNGSGTFVINTAGQPVVSGTVISSTAFNALTADLATGLSTAITKDGQTTPTANIPMGNNKITGLAVGTAATDAANLSQVQSTAAKLVNSVSGADTITGTMSPNLGAYATGQMFYFVAVGANTGAVTINIDSLGAKSITRDGTTALAAGDIQSGEVCVIVYDGTQFQLVNGASQSASIVTENLTVNKATVLNESGGDNDTRIEGDTDANLFFADASTDRIGIGTSSPATKLAVNGAVQILAGNALNFQNASASANGTISGSGGSGENTLSFNSGALLLNASGNLGLGVTPSAWVEGTGLNVGSGRGGSIFTETVNYGFTTFNANAYYSATDTWKYVTSNAASRYQQLNGVHSWYTAPSGTAGNNITFTQAMTLSSTVDRGTLDVNGNTQALFSFSHGGTRKSYIYQVTDDLIVMNESNGYLGFGTNGSERARISAGGYWKASNAGTYIGSTGSYHEIRQSANSDGLYVNGTNASLTNTVLYPYSFRSADSGFSVIKAAVQDGADVVFNFRGDGNGYADGTWNNNGADYAEYFESATGGALTVGATVVLEGNKVREATASDPASAIMGVVRPKEPGKASMIVGNTAWNKWANQYLTDDFDRYIMEDHDVVAWTDDDGKEHSYESHRIPADVVIPADAAIKTHDEKGNKFQHYKLNPAYNPNAEYTPREKRDEWIIVGLVGQVKVLKGKPVNDRWIKMRDVSAAVEEWMIR